VSSITYGYKPGLTLLLPDEEQVGFFRARGGSPEEPLIRWAAELVQPGDVFVDVGAHVGTWSLSMAARGCRVAAFEPQNDTFCRLAAGVALSGLEAQVEVHRVALSAEDGHMLLRVTTRDGGGSSLGNYAERILGKPPIRTEAVEVRTLDSFGYDRIDLLKIDAEGEELNVLLGAEATLKRCRPRILFECWSYDWFADQRTKVLDYLEYVGYRIVPTSWTDTFLAEPA